MRFQVTNPEITSLSVGSDGNTSDESHDVVNGVVQVPTTDEARAALQVLIDRGVLVGLPDEVAPAAPPVEPPADESGEEKKSAAKKAK